MPKRSRSKASKRGSRKTSRKASRPRRSKKTSRKGTKKTSRKGTKKTSRRGSKKRSRKMSHNNPWMTFLNHVRPVLKKRGVTKPGEVSAIAKKYYTKANKDLTTAIKLFNEAEK